MQAKVIEGHTPRDVSDSLLSMLFVASTEVSARTSPSRSGYEEAENRQNGADSPILSLLKAIYNKQKFQSLTHKRMLRRILKMNHEKTRFCKVFQR